MLVSFFKNLIGGNLFNEQLIETSRKCSWQKPLEGYLTKDLKIYNWQFFKKRIVDRNHQKMQLMEFFRRLMKLQKVPCDNIHLEIPMAPPSNLTNIGCNPIPFHVFAYIMIYFLKKSFSYCSLLSFLFCEVHIVRG